MQHGVAVEARRDDVGDRLLALDQPLQDLVEHVVGRQRVLVLLVLAQLRGRRLGDDVLRDHLAVGPERAFRLPRLRSRDSRNTSVL